MSTIDTVDNLPVWGAERPEGYVRLRRRPQFVPTSTRRLFLGGFLAAGTGLSMGVLGLFSGVRRASAGHSSSYPKTVDLPGSEGYEVRTDTNNNNGCGPLYSGAGTCAEPCGGEESWNDHGFCTEGTYPWHRNEGIDYVIANGHGHTLRPDACHGNFSSDAGQRDADAWLWRTDNTCWPCSGQQTVRCHDGWKYSNWSGQKTICPGFYGCV